MKVFLSWSGSRSKKIAEILHNWLPQVIQAVEPWFSTDIEKGLRWGPEITDLLEKSKVGIICLTRENLDENWILFEAGALSKTKDAYVCTFLLDMKPTDIKPPLAQFQHTQFKREDVWKLILTINENVKKSGGTSPSKEILKIIFDKFWPDLEKKLEKITKQQPERTEPTRSDREILEEILEYVRTLVKREEQGDELQRTLPFYSYGKM